MSPALTQMEPSPQAELTSTGSAQLNLFPETTLHIVVRQDTNRRPIKMPRSILTIAPNELLSDYLSRVANSAMTAATHSYGTATLAATRLGTSDNDPGPATEPRPKLSLAKRAV